MDSHNPEAGDLPQSETTLISYRSILSQSTPYFTLGIKSYALAILSILACVVAAIGVGLILGIGAIVGGFVGMPSGALLALLVVVLAAVVWLHVFLSHMAAVSTILARRGARRYGEELKRMYKNWWRLLALVFSIQVLVTAGLMLFVIPGIVALIYLSFALYSFLTEVPSVRTSLARSVTLVHGRFWSIGLRLGVIVVTVFFTMFTLMLVGIAFPVLYFTIPFLFLLGSLATMAVFHSAVATRPRTESAPQITKNDTQLYIALMALAAFFLAAMSMVMPQAERHGHERTTSLIGALEDARLSGELLAYKDAATTLIEKASAYKAENLTFENLCVHDSEFVTGLRAFATQFEAGVNCESTSETYVVEGKLSSGEFFCFDSLEKMHVSITERTEQFSCGF